MPRSISCCIKIHVKNSKERLSLAKVNRLSIRGAYYGLLLRGLYNYSTIFEKKHYTLLLFYIILLMSSVEQNNELMTMIFENTINRKKKKASAKSLGCY
ncbi:hypothetical protein BpHYR1_050246 [Brachionus plicatilis]|uniref:Uncharacterized protein n=1 Tax=Brachionus plicatilis TaxID=10195 RepID=A0A3M7RJK0_BRAPC|nr:hypothetical protein BpHYR1_050246 [Brachionus plicatilis]